MKKNLMQVFVVLMIIMSVMLIFSNLCFAGETPEETGGNGSNWQTTMIKDADKTSGEWQPTGNVSKNVKSVMGTAINVIRIVGTGIALIMITYIAIKYMSAAPNEKAEFKKSATGFIVGAVVLFAATNILTMISEFALEVTK